MAPTHSDVVGASIFLLSAGILLEIFVTGVAGVQSSLT
jgi:hypothetical protein